VAAAKIDAPVPRERPPKTRPATKHLRIIPRPLCSSVLSILREPVTDSRRRESWLPLASPSFLHRVTARSREIIRRSDGQLMLAALLASGGGPDGASG